MDREAPLDERKALATELATARDAFLAALGDVEPALLDAPGLVGEWSARELVAHMAYWSEHAAAALDHAAQGRLPDFEEPGLSVDQRNAEIAREAAGTDLASLRRREVAAFGVLLERLRTADPAWFDERVGYGDTLAQVIRDDGADHYREHAADIRAWFAEADAEADADDEAEADADAGDAES